MLRHDLSPQQLGNTINDAHSVCVKDLYRRRNLITMNIIDPKLPAGFAFILAIACLCVGHLLARCGIEGF